MLIWSIFILVLIIIFLFRRLDVKSSLFIALAGIFTYYLAGYKIRIDLIFNQLTLTQLLSLIALLVSCFLLYYLFKVMDKTKIFNDWHNFTVAIFPYTVQKMVLLFYIGQILLVDYQYIFLTLIFYMIIARALKISRLHSVIILTMATTLNLLVNNITFVTSNSIEKFNFTDTLFNEQTLFILILNAISIFIIIFLDRFSYRSTKDLERINLHVKNYALLFFTVVIAYTISLFVFEIYFDLYISQILSSIIAVLVLAVVSKMGFKKLDFLDFDDFFQRKEDNIAILISFLVLVVLVFAYFIGLLINIFIAIFIFALLIIFVLKVYKPVLGEIDINLSDYAIMAIILVSFWINNILIDQSIYNNSDFLVSVSQSAFNYLSSSTNSFLDALKFILLFPFLLTQNLYYIITMQNNDSLELFATQIFTVATSYSMFVLVFLIKFIRVKQTDLTELFSALIFYLGVFLVASYLIFII